MKKIVKFTVILFGLAGVLSSCSEKYIPVNDIVLMLRPFGSSTTTWVVDPAVIHQIPIGENSFILEAVLYPRNATNQAVEWFSHTSVAIVNDGRITPISQGDAIITAITLSGNLGAIFRIRVTPRFEGWSNFTDSNTNEEPLVWRKPL
ncbi:MAG: hypothetical protein FWC10_09415 [Lentimicrobiaceae bacterium]|nr:hypothetical protein [Lentimicrobiaceae bacterium]